MYNKCKLLAILTSHDFKCVNDARIVLPPSNEVYNQIADAMIQNGSEITGTDCMILFCMLLILKKCHILRMRLLGMFPRRHVKEYWHKNISNCYLFWPMGPNKTQKDCQVL